MPDAAYVDIANGRVSFIEADSIASYLERIER
jgi:hypothetical protein